MLSDRPLLPQKRLWPTEVLETVVNRTCATLQGFESVCVALDSAKSSGGLSSIMEASEQNLEVSKEESSGETRPLSESLRNAEWG